MQDNDSFLKNQKIIIKQNMNFKNKKIIATMIFFGISFFFCWNLNNFVFAEESSESWGQYTPLAPLPGTTNEEGTTDIQTYLPGVFNLAIGIAGVLAVLMIIIGGVQYITTDAIQGKSEGKERIRNALWGLVLVLVSWILLYTINPKLTVFNLNIEKSTSVTEEDTSDNPYINTGESTTGLKQPSNSSSGINKFEQNTSSSES